MQSERGSATVSDDLLGSPMEDGAEWLRMVNADRVFPHAYLGCSPYCVCRPACLASSPLGDMKAGETTADSAAPVNFEGRLDAVASRHLPFGGRSLLPD